MLLDEFTKIACEAAIRGENIMTCMELADPKYLPLMDMIRPFNKPTVLDKMPVVAAESRKRKREAEAVPDEPLVQRQRTIDPILATLTTDWERVLFALYYTNMFTASAQYATGDADNMVHEVLSSFGYNTRVNHSFDTLLNKHYIEDIPGFVKMSEAGKAAAASIQSPQRVQVVPQVPIQIVLPSEFVQELLNELENSVGALNVAANQLALNFITSSPEYLDLSNQGYSLYNRRKLLVIKDTSMAGHIGNANAVKNAFEQGLAIKPIGVSADANVSKYMTILVDARQQEMKAYITYAS